MEKVALQLIISLILYRCRKLSRKGGFFVLFCSMFEYIASLLSYFRPSVLLIVSLNYFRRNGGRRNGLYQGHSGFGEG